MFHMIKINLIGRKKKRRSGLPLSKTLSLKGLTQAARTPLVVGVLVLASIILTGELLYLYKLKSDINDLQRDISRLEAEKKDLENKLKSFREEERYLRTQINEVRKSIDNTKRLMEVVGVLKRYHEPFYSSLHNLYARTPSTVWFYTLSQSLDLNSIRGTLSIGSYSMDGIKRQINLLKKEDMRIRLSAIERKQNKLGVEYYTSTLELEGDVFLEGE